MALWLGFVDSEVHKQVIYIHTPSSQKTDQGPFLPWKHCNWQTIIVAVWMQYGIYIKPSMGYWKSYLIVQKAKLFENPDIFIWLGAVFGCKSGGSAVHCMTGFEHADF
jgi:hypothetical protein